MRRLGDRYRALSSIAERRTFLVENGCPPGMAGVSVDYRPRSSPPRTYDSSHSLPPGSGARDAIEAERAAEADAQARLREQHAAEGWTGFRTLTDEFTGEVRHRVQATFSNRPLEMMAITAQTGGEGATIVFRFYDQRSPRYDTCHPINGLGDANRLTLTDAEYAQRGADEGGFFETITVRISREMLGVISQATVVRFRVCSDVVQLPPDLPGHVRELLLAMDAEPTVAAPP